MSANEKAGLILAVIGIFAALFKALQWLIRTEVADIKHETTSNGGSSMNDFIKLQILPLLKDMRQDQLDIKGSVSELHGWKDEHVRDHA